ncbi:MAG: BON domain-containing protein [Planctomycetota bacterium]
MRRSLAIQRTFTATVLALLFSAPGFAQEETANNQAETGGGTQFSAEEVDVSAFDEIDRGDSIGGSANQGFGLSAGQPTNTGGFGGGGGGGGFGGLGGLFGGLGGAFGGNQGTGSQRPVIRVRLRSAINVAPLADSRVQSNANRRLVSIPSSQRTPNVRVSVSKGTAVLTGSVQSERDRRMTQLLMRLEPGVKKIDNRIVVSP